MSRCIRLASTTFAILILSGACGGSTGKHGSPSPRDGGSEAGEPVCGNGAVELGEACDDGNDDDHDGCSADCSLLDICEFPRDWGSSPCRKPRKRYYYYDISKNRCARLDYTGCGGNENRFKNREQCERACLAVCGDGVVSGTEECDDGNREDGDGCSSECAWEGGLVALHVSPRNNQCPTVHEYSVSPLQVAIGGHLTLTESIVDPNGDSVTVEWTAQAGSISRDSASNSFRYECTEVGEHTLTLTARDAHGCEIEPVLVDVTCVAE